LQTRARLASEGSPGRLYVIDRHSCNGTLVNGARIRPNEEWEVPLGATLAFGDALRAQYTLGAAAAPGEGAASVAGAAAVAEAAAAAATAAAEQSSA